MADLKNNPELTIQEDIMSLRLENKRLNEQKNKLMEQNVVLFKENEDLKAYVEKLSENHAEEWHKQQEVITSLRVQIETFLSCKDCPSNNGGYICDAEYNGKCLSQKVQEIKELKEQLKKYDSTRAD